jgi:alpha-N-arabinofuranosidase
MRAVDPSIRVIAVGRDRTDWNRQVLDIAGRDIDLLSIHHYDGPPDLPEPRDLMARPLHWEAWYRELAALIRERVPGRHIGVIVNEWNSVLPLPRQHSMEAALYAARLMNVFERSGDLVEMTAVSDLVNGWPGGIIQAGRHGVHVTPTYRAIQLYAQHLGAERLAATVESPTFDTSNGPKAVPYVDVTASRSADGRRYILKIVNTNLASAVRLRVSFAGWRPPAHGTLHTLTAPTLQTANSFAVPDAVAVTTRAIATGNAFTIELPQYSVNVLVLGEP